MTKLNDLGLPSGFQESTYQQNREQLEYPVGYAFMSKTELRRAFNALLRENRGLKEKMNLKENESTLREEIQSLKIEARKYYNESHYYKDKCLVLHEKLQQKEGEVETNLRLAV